MNDNIGTGKAAQPYAYHWRQERMKQGWIYVGYLMPPPAVEQFRDWYRSYKRNHKEQFELKGQ